MSLFLNNFKFWSNHVGIKACRRQNNNILIIARNHKRTMLCQKSAIHISRIPFIHKKQITNKLSIWIKSICVAILFYGDSLDVSYALKSNLNLKATISEKKQLPYYKVPEYFLFRSGTTFILLSFVFLTLS